MARKPKATAAAASSEPVRPELTETKEEAVPTEAGTFLFFADAHLQRGAWAHRPDISGDARDAFGQIINAAVRHGVKWVVDGGDTFDGQPEPEDVALFLDGMAILERHGIGYLYVQGQHGRSRGLPWPGVCKRTVHLPSRPPVAVGPGVFLIGLDNLPPDRLKEKLATVPSNVSILVLHQMLRGVVPEVPGREETWDLDPVWVPPHVKLVLLGDYHAPESLEYESGGGVPWCRYFYNGSCAMQSLKEPSAKSYLLVHPDGRVVREPLNSRPFLVREIADATQWAALLADVPGMPINSLVHVRYHRRMAEVFDGDPWAALYKARGERAVHFHLTELMEETATGTPPEPPAGSPVLSGFVDSLVSRDQEPQLHALAVELLQRDGSAREAVAGARQRFLEARRPPAVPAPVTAEARADNG